MQNILFVTFSNSGGASSEQHSLLTVVRLTQLFGLFQVFLSTLNIAEIQLLQNLFRGPNLNFVVNVVFTVLWIAIISPRSGDCSFCVCAASRLVSGLMVHSGIRRQTQAAPAAVSRGGSRIDAPLPLRFSRCFAFEPSVPQ